jgi:RND family efflux transporter MFP subunit
MPRSLYWLAAAAPLLAGLAACSKKHAPQASAIPGQPPVVAVVPAVRQTLDNTVTLVAEFRPNREIDVMAKVSGYVKSINVDLGDRVQTGQVLATLEIPEMADDLNRAEASINRSTAETQRAREDVRRAESASQMAQLQFDRLSNVVKARPGLVAQQEIDNARARALEASAQLAAARSSLIAAEEAVRVNRADESRVKTMFAYTKVTAPFPGVVVRRFAEVGAMVQAGTSSQTNVLPIVRLAQDNVLRLQLPIPESNVPRVKVGFPVSVHIPTLDLTIPGKIARYSGQLILATRTMLAEVDIPNGDLKIKPGMFAEVLFSFDARVNALTVPLLAFDGSGENRKALIVTPAGLVEERNIATGIESSDLVEVLSGAQEGDKFVIGNRAQLRPGMKVTPRISTSFGKGQ